MRNVFLLSLATILFIGLCPDISMAQNRPQPDERLSVKFSETELKQMDDETLAYWNYYLDNSFDVIAIPKGKENQILSLVKTTSTNRNEINILELGIESHAYARTYYRIEGTEKVIVLFGEKEITRNRKAK